MNRCVCADTLMGQQVSSRLPPSMCIPPTGDVVDVHQLEFLALRPLACSRAGEPQALQGELNLVLDEIKRPCPRDRHFEMETAPHLGPPTW